MVEFTLYSYVIFTLSLWWSRTFTYWLFPPSLNGGVYHLLIISTYLHGVVYLSLSRRQFPSHSYSGVCHPHIDNINFSTMQIQSSLIVGIVNFL